MLSLSQLFNLDHPEADVYLEMPTCQLPRPQSQYVDVALRENCKLTMNTK